MNLFWKKLSGKIKSTSKYEKDQKTLMEKFVRYSKIEKSKELAEYKMLFDVVQSAEFKEKKNTLLYRKYKDTSYYRNLKKFEKLQANKKLQMYFEHLNDDLLQEFLEFKSTDDYELLGKKKEVKKSEKLQTYKRFEKSKIYKNYVRFHNTYIVDDFLKIKEEVSTDAFKAENEFWANKNRWQTTPEYETEQRFTTLANNPDIVFYESIDAVIFDEIKNLQLVFEDNFDGNTILDENWEYGFRYPSYKLMSNHSFVNERQANNSGKNVNATNGCLAIHTKKETVKASAWDASKGFVEKEFNYTSDVLHSKEFKQKGGVFSAKIRCTGKLHHAFWLSGESRKNHVNVFHFNGKHITMGNATAEGFFDQIELTGLSASAYYVYSLEWTEKELIWYVNNYEVYRTQNNVPQEELFLTFNSFIAESQKPSTGVFEVDWLKVFVRK